MADDHPLWRDESTWPRWLLHVNTLTSHPWQPGNTYRGVPSPAYNAISYTWGRFQDESGQANTFPLRGISWKDSLPHIKSNHYSVNDLIANVKVASCPFSGYDKVDFLWLDIACIDQRPGTKSNPNMAKAKEIGRQARIFKGAKDVFIWLTTHDTNSLVSWIHAMHRDCGLGFRGEFKNPTDATRWLKDMKGHLEGFTRDPWFGSLWTLQEAFLSPNAIFLLRDGLSAQILELSRDGGGQIMPMRLRSWVQNWHFVRSALAAYDREMYPEASELEKAIENIGFIDAIRNQSLTGQLDDDEYPSTATGNPLALLVASTHRNPWREVDRVYGIMQVFDLQLGESAPRETRTDFTLEELIDQLGAALLEKYPIASQLVIHNANCPDNKAWRISSNMSISDEGHRFWRHFAHGGEVLTDVKLGTIRDYNTMLASFSGYTSPFQNWCHSIDQVGSRLSVDKKWGKPGDDGAPDRSTCRWLMDTFPGLQILLLGRTKPPSVCESAERALNYHTYAIGLLLSPERIPLRYKRIGTFVWEDKGNSRVSLSPWESWSYVKGGRFG